MRALGRRDLPATIQLNGVTFRHQKTIKHDFFAATGFYASDDGRQAVVKMSRTEDFAGIPLLWLGRWLCRREIRFYQRLSDLPNVPRLLGAVGQTGFAHEFVPGRPLSKDHPPPDGFFDQLIALLRELHRRNIAYVDTNKPQNILLGDDGRPHLIDFQISYDLHDLGNWWLSRMILRQLQREDIYHILKHKQRLRPDELTQDERAAAGRRSWLIRLHRFIFWPYFRLRRRTFRRLRQTGRLLPDSAE